MQNPTTARGAETRIKLGQCRQILFEKKKKKAPVFKEALSKARRNTPIHRALPATQKIKYTFPFSSPGSDYGKPEGKKDKNTLPCNLSPLLPEPLEVKRVMLGSAQSASRHGCTFQRRRARLGL